MNFLKIFFLASLFVVTFSITQAYPIPLGDDYERVGNLDVKVLNELWRVVGSRNLDKDFYPPVLLDPQSLKTSEIFLQIKKAIPVISQLSLKSTGFKAIDDFASADEGPDGDPQFLPIAQALKSKDIIKRFYFIGGENAPFPWSYNLLLVLDSKGQLFGFGMGYSE